MRTRTQAQARGRIAGWMIPIVAGCAAACSDGGLAPGADTTVTFTREQLLDPQTCNQCHQDHYKEWSGSMHAYASKDPVFLAMNKRGQKETNGALGDFCVKCHAPMALSEGATTNGMELESVPDKLQGVTCYFCHNVTDVTDTHNNPLKLSNDVTMRGGIKNPLKFKGHDSEYSKLFDDDAAQAGFMSSNLCGSCHDISVPAHFSGASADVPLEQTFAEWKTSVFADPTGNGLNLNCSSGGGCHMDRQALVPIANPPLPHPTMPTRSARHLHDFPAIDTALTDFPEKDTQLAAVKDKLATEFRIEICADGPQDFSGKAAILLENLSAGHYVPSGASQDRRLWVEMHAYKGTTELTSSGVVPDGMAATSVPDTWILYNQAFKADGVTPAHMFWDVATTNPIVIPVSTPQAGGANVLSHKQFSNVTQPDRVTVTIWVEAMGLDVIDDMIASTFLDASYRNAIQRFPVELASAQPGPTPDNRPVTFDWTLTKAMDTTAYHKMGQTCVENTQPLYAVTPPPASP